MPTERAIVLPKSLLETLNRKDLLALVTHFDLAVAKGRSREAMVQALVAARKLRLPEILAQLPAASLKALCKTIGVDDAGRQKAAFVTRLVGATRGKSKAAAKPAKSAKPAAKPAKAAVAAKPAKGKGRKVAAKPAKSGAAKRGETAATKSKAAAKPAKSGAAKSGAAKSAAAKSKVVAKPAKPEVRAAAAQLKAIVATPKAEATPKAAATPAVAVKSGANVEPQGVAAAKVKPAAVASVEAPKPDAKPAQPTVEVKAKPTLLAVPDPTPVAAATPQGMTPLNPSRKLDWPSNLPTSPMPLREVSGPTLTPRASTESCITCAARIELRKCSVQRCDNHIIVTPTQKICAECMFERNTLSMDDFMQRLREESTCPHCGEAWRAAS